MFSVQRRQHFPHDPHHLSGKTQRPPRPPRLKVRGRSVYKSRGASVDIADLGSAQTEQGKSCSTLVRWKDGGERPEISFSDPRPQPSPGHLAVCRSRHSDIGRIAPRTVSLRGPDQSRPQRIVISPRPSMARGAPRQTNHARSKTLSKNASTSRGASNARTSATY